jgi:hypothetical protein
MSATLLQVSDLPSNFSEQLEFYAQHLAAPQRRKVFEEIYRGHKKPRYVSELSAKTKMGSVRVAQEAAKLANIGLLTKGRNKNPAAGRSETFYQKRPEIAVHKNRLLKLATDPKARNALATKRRPAIAVNVKTVRVEYPKKLVRVRHITIDDIDSFKAVAGVAPAATKLTGLSEAAFRSGIQSIIGEKGVFKDWAGEKSDLMTTRLTFQGKRVRAAFAFKGPGQSGKLTIAKMGKNGDQGPRLFEEAADIFVIQHWSQIDAQVHKFVETLAVAKSVTSSREVRFCLIDGQDSDRLVRAYPKHFAKRGL